MSLSDLLTIGASTGRPIAKKYCLIILIIALLAYLTSTCMAQTEPTKIVNGHADNEYIYLASYSKTSPIDLGTIYIYNKINYELDKVISLPASSYMTSNDKYFICSYYQSHSSGIAIYDKKNNFNLVSMKELYYSSSDNEGHVCQPLIDDKNIYAIIRQAGGDNSWIGIYSPSPPFSFIKKIQAATGDANSGALDDKYIGIATAFYGLHQYVYNKQTGIQVADIVGPTHASDMEFYKQKYLFIGWNSNYYRKYIYDNFLAPYKQVYIPGASRFWDCGLKQISGSPYLRLFLRMTDGTDKVKVLNPETDEIVATLDNSRDGWIQALTYGASLPELNIVLSPSKNVAQSGETVPVHISVTSYSVPVDADVEIKINNQIVSSFKGSDYTYNFPSLPTQKNIGGYNIEATATYNGMIARDLKKIEVIGDVSKTLALVEDLHLAAQREVFQSQDIAIEAFLKSSVALGLVLMNEFFLKVDLKDAIGKVYPASVYPDMQEFIPGFIQACNQAAKVEESSKIKLQTAAFFAIYDTIGGPYSIKLGKDKIDIDSAEFIEYINNNKKNFSDSSKFVPIISKFKTSITDIVEGREITNSPIGHTEKEQYSTWKELDQWSWIWMALAILACILAGIAVIYICMGTIVLGCIIPVFASFAPILTKMLIYIKYLSTGWTIIKFALSLVLLLSMFQVCGIIPDEHLSGLKAMEAISLHPIMSSPEMSDFLNMQVDGVLSGQSIKINSNGYLFATRPDGRIIRLEDGIFNAHKSGRYTITGCLSDGNRFFYISPAKLNVAKPNIKVNASYSVSGKIANVSLQIRNNENSSMENLIILLDIRNSSNDNVYANMDNINLAALESRNISYEVSLENNDIYTAKATVSQDFGDILTEKTFPIPICISTIDDATILDINSLSEYSPHNNVTMNVTVQSYSPELAFNISIPSLNYTKPVIITGTQLIEITLPKLKQDYYSIGIIAERDAKVLDSRVVNFYVRADGIGFLTFNTNKILYTLGELATTNLSLKDLNLTNVDAQVGVTVRDPAGEPHDFAANKTSDGYQFDFRPITNGTYMLEAHASKEGWRIDNNTFTVIVDQMSPLNMSVTMGEYILANVTANGQPAACNVTLYTPQGSESVITSNGLALFNATNQFYIVADKMFFEPAFYSFEPHSISGIKFNDTNSNATRDAGEAGLSGWTIRLTRPDGTTINATTDANGAYKFENLTSGTYRVSEVRQSNWTQTYPAWLGDHTVNITDSNITGVDFGNNYLLVPEIPLPPSGPASGVPGTEYSYSTSAADPNSYQIAYAFDWGDGSNSTTGLFDSGAVASAAHVWNSTGVYQVRAMATDSKGASSGWSDPLVVSITNPILGWKALGGVITSSPSAIIDNQDQTEVWVKGGDNALWLNIDGSWQGKGGYLTSDPFAAEDYNGRIHVLARGGDNGAWDFIYDPVTQSGEWVGLGGYITEGFTAAKDPANHNLMRVAARGGDEALWTCDLDINAKSSSWSFQGGVLTSRPYIIFDPSGREHILVKGGDNALWDRNGEWTGSSYARTWSPLGGILANNPIATTVPGADSRIAVFAKGGDDAVWMCDVDSSSETETGSWHRLGGVIRSDIFAIADTSSSKIHTFARGSDMALWENAFTTSPWNPEGGQWQYHGGLILDYRPGATLTGVTQAFVIGTDNSLWQNTQATASATAGDARSGESEAEREIQSSITDQDRRMQRPN